MTYIDRMNSTELKQFQREHGLRNVDVAKATGRTAQTVSNWRVGRQAIPHYVAIVLDHVIFLSETGQSAARRA
jgi:DNA-binding transcriptional regulator YiaG